MRARLRHQRDRASHRGRESSRLARASAVDRRRARATVSVIDSWTPRDDHGGERERRAREKASKWVRHSRRRDGRDRGRAGDARRGDCERDWFPHSWIG